MKTCTKPTHKLINTMLEHPGAKMSHGRFWTYKTHHGPDSGEATTFPHIIYSAPLQGTLIQMVFFVPGIPKSPRLELPWLCETITSFVDLRSRWGLKWSYSPRRELFNDMSHATYTQGNRVDSWLSMVGSQTANLTLVLSFGHNLCFRCPNGSCEPILNIYISIFFQWYK
jgi:hypothetical protein